MSYSDAKVSSLYCGCFSLSKLQRAPVQHWPAPDEWKKLELDSSVLIFTAKGVCQEKKVTFPFVLLLSYRLSRQTIWSPVRIYSFFSFLLNTQCQIFNNADSISHFVFISCIKVFSLSMQGEMFLLPRLISKPSAPRRARRYVGHFRGLVVAGGETQTLSSIGKTRRVPRLNSSCSRESNSRSRASSEVLQLLFPLELQPDPSAPSNTLLAVMAVSPKVKVRSPSFRMKSDSWSLSCSWFWKHIHNRNMRGGMANMRWGACSRGRWLTRDTVG